MSEFSGKTAIVTGAAQGMGREYARLLVESGANVVLADLNEEGLQKTTNELGHADRLLAVTTDVGSIDACNACAAAAIDRFGGVDFLVNNAGVLAVAFHRSLIQVPTETYLQMFNVMAHSMLWMARAVVPSMRARGGGAIVNVSSIGSWQAQGLYSLTKLCVNGLTVNLARELANDEIRVNAIAPGTVATAGMAPIMTVEQMAQWGRMNGRPTDRVATPEQIARVGLFLLSDAASYIRGQIIAVDDGQEVRV